MRLGQEGGGGTWDIRPASVAAGLVTKKKESVGGHFILHPKQGGRVSEVAKNGFSKKKEEWKSWTK